MLIGADSIGAALRDHVAVPDEVFDQLYPALQRERSAVHWTPVAVAMRAAALLAPDTQRVLDVGAGVGKLCLVGALTQGPGTRWCGVEREPTMVRAATSAARWLRVSDTATFLAGDAASLDWNEFDAFYLYNPFAEALFAANVDPLSLHGNYVETVTFFVQRLAALRAGTRVVTYHGLGGAMPAGYTLTHREKAGEDELRLYVRD